MISTQTILVIDDHVSLASGFAKALEREGYTAHTANTAEEGLRLVETTHPDAIVLDFRMPFINGAGFLYRLRAMAGNRETPVLVITGGGVNDELRAELTDLHAVLRFKPLAIEELIAEVRALLAASHGPCRSIPSDTSH